MLLSFRLQLYSVHPTAWTVKDDIAREKLQKGEKLDERINKKNRNQETGNKILNKNKEPKSYANEISAPYLLIINILIRKWNVKNVQKISNITVQAVQSKRQGGKGHLAQS